MPTPLLFLYLPWHLIMSVLAILVGAMRGQGMTVVRAKWDAAKAYKEIYTKRKKIQKTRKVSSLTLLPLMARGFISFVKR